MANSRRRRKNNKVDKTTPECQKPLINVMENLPSQSNGLEKPVSLEQRRSLPSSSPKQCNFCLELWSNLQNLTQEIVAMKLRINQLEKENYSGTQSDYANDYENDNGDNLSEESNEIDDEGEEYEHPVIPPPPEFRDIDRVKFTRLYALSLMKDLRILRLQDARTIKTLTEGEIIQDLHVKTNFYVQKSEEELKTADSFIEEFKSDIRTGKFQELCDTIVDEYNGYGVSNAMPFYNPKNDYFENDVRNRDYVQVLLESGDFEIVLDEHLEKINLICYFDSEKKDLETFVDDLLPLYYYGDVISEEDALALNGTIFRNDY